jgi:hypothetical protein
MLEELEKINLENKERYVGLFRNLLENAQKGSIRDEDYEDCILVRENLKGKELITIVPNLLINLFKELREKYPDEFLGFSVLVNNKRISCFGVECSELGKAVIK